MSHLTLSEPFGKPFANPNFGKTPTPVPVPVPTTAPTTSPSTHQYQHRHLPNAQRVRDLVDARMNLTAVETTAEKSNLIEIQQAPATKRGTMTTPRTAASSDARKRLAEAGASESLPPVLPDTSGWVQQNPDALATPHTPFVMFGTTDDEGSFTAADTTVLTPPPVPREPWESLPSRRSDALLAAVEFRGQPDPIEGQWYVAGPYLKRRHDVTDWRLEDVRSVELLSTHDPVTQVPVDRALIDEAVHHARFLTQAKAARPNRGLLAVLADLAALADAAVSKDADQ